MSDQSFEGIQYFLPFLCLVLAPAVGAQNLVDLKTTSLADLPTLVYDPVVGAVDGDNGIYSKGATGFGTRLLIDLACNFERPSNLMAGA